MKRIFLAAELLLCLAAQSVGAQELLNGFLCCNMHSDGQAISDINIDDPDQHLVAVGTPIRVTAYAKHHLKVAVENKNQSLSNDYSRDISMTEFAKRFIVADDPRVKILTFPKNVQYAISLGHLVKGMTREQVIMSLGYPVSSDNPNLNSASWTYWITDKVQYRVKFDGQDRLADVENVVDARARLLTE